MAMTMEQPSKCVFMILDTIVDGKGVQKASWIVPALYAACDTSTMLVISGETNLPTW